MIYPGKWQNLQQKYDIIDNIRQTCSIIKKQYIDVIEEQLKQMTALCKTFNNSIQLINYNAKK